MTIAERAFGTGEHGGKTEDGAVAGPTLLQWLMIGALVELIALTMYFAPDVAAAVGHANLVVGFILSSLIKLALALIGRKPAAPTPLRRDLLPRYTLLVPLYREAAVAAQLVRAISAIDYPRDRLQAVLLLEADDPETLDALAWMRLPPFIEVLVKPPGGPRTKPNALNAGLRIARGEFIAVYDAEDIPAPGQLREAAARFAATPDLACVQAPLRITPGATLLQRQFALEYAGQFDGVLQGLARLGACFPLGGTSNHFRTAVLRQLGGWDAYNVTEDADLGFRLGAAGHRIGMIAAPTHEDAPLHFKDWLPQRTRWVKGYMQTWGVHTRQPFEGGVIRLLSLQITLGAAIMGAALHGPLSLLLLAVLMSDLFGGNISAGLKIDLVVFAIAWGSASAANLIGARRAGLKVGPLDALASLLYWPLQSLAFLRAGRELVVAPYYWAKTPHAPAANAPSPAQPLDADAPWSVSPAA